jgi:hypothetical protein
MEIRTRHMGIAGHVLKCPLLSAMHGTCENTEQTERRETGEEL